jgi:translation initiation factor 2D
MFKKPLAHQSNATPLRSSARRQLLASVTAQYPLLIPTDNDNENEGGPSGKEIGKLVLPEGVRTTTFETSGGVEGVSPCYVVGRSMADR